MSDSRLKKKEFIAYIKHRLQRSVSFSYVTATFIASEHARYSNSFILVPL